jgi:hypothetical protein
MAYTLFGHCSANSSPEQLWDLAVPSYYPAAMLDDEQRTARHDDTRRRGDDLTST